MADRPIILSAPMVQALLEGRKTQTRRILKGACSGTPDAKDGRYLVIDKTGSLAWKSLPCAPGDRLWVREAHAFVPSSAYRMGEGVTQAVNPADRYEAAIYRAGWDRSGSQRWRPSIHMPLWASRITLDVTEVRVQRLQEISEEDARAEGVEEEVFPPEWPTMYERRYWKGYENRQRAHRDTARDSYSSLWNRLHGPGAWDANPWVCALTFRVHICNIDRREAA